MRDVTFLHTIPPGSTISDFRQESDGVSLIYVPPDQPPVLLRIRFGVKIVVEETRVSPDFSVTVGA